MAVVDKAEVDLAGRVAETQAWFRQAHQELKVAQDLLAERKLELVMKQDDIEKAQELAREQAAKDKASRHQHQVAATLHGKDEEVEKLIVQQTQELEQRHEEALNAQAQVQAGKVKELEVERDGLKDQARKLAKEKDTLNSALIEAQAAVLGKVKAREDTLTKNLEKERQLRKNDAAYHEDFVKGENFRISRLADVAEFSRPGIMSSPSPNNAGDDAWLMKIEMKREELGEIKKGDRINKAAEDQAPTAEEEDILQPHYNLITPTEIEAFKMIEIARIIPLKGIIRKLENLLRSMLDDNPASSTTPSSPPLKKEI
nr:protein KASH5-like [Aegilops tauschii subsp. strangulata]